MVLWPVARLTDRMLYDTMRDLERFERCLFPYWTEADQSVLHVANETQQMVNDDKKFAVSLDVSQFRPEELNVQLEGRQLTIEGKQEHKTENSAFVPSSMTRAICQWRLRRIPRATRSRKLFLSCPL
ncbi:hypothetical protein V3C99_005726, partial [Haemonchus contortus]